MEMLPTITKVAGFEWGTGFYINPVIPKMQQKFLERIYPLRFSSF